MFGIFQLIFSLASILIYSIVYAGIVLTLLYTISKFATIEIIKRMMSFKFLTFIILGTFFGVAFLFYRFSYWQDSGFGDSYIIPIGNNYQVNNIDNAWSYFEDSKSGGGRQASITTFAVVDKKLCASFQGFNSTNCNDCYIVFDTELEKLYEFHSAKEYETFALQSHLPMTNSFKGFTENYNNYWSQNNKWYLP